MRAKETYGSVTEIEKAVAENTRGQVALPEKLDA
jgi:hypothetical protein